MMLVVFVKKAHKNHIQEVAAEHVGTGIMGKMVCSPSILTDSTLHLYSNIKVLHILISCINIP